MMKKLSIFNFQFSKDEEGVTLIISIVLLAAVTFISFSISTIAIREIGVSRLILRTEPAFAGANSGGEVGLYKLLRETGGTTGSGSLSLSGASYVLTSKLYDNDPSPFAITTGEVFNIALYNPENTSDKSQFYESFVVTNTGQNAFRVSVVSWSTPKTEFCRQTVPPGQSTPTCTLVFAGDGRYLISIDPSGQAAAGTLSALHSDGSRGVPATTPTLDVTGTSGSVERRIKIDVTTQ